MPPLHNIPIASQTRWVDKRLLDTQVPEAWDPDCVYPVLSWAPWRARDSVSPSVKWVWRHQLLSPAVKGLALQSRY